MYGGFLIPIGFTIWWLFGGLKSIKNKPYKIVLLSLFFISTFFSIILFIHHQETELMIQNPFILQPPSKIKLYGGDTPPAKDSFLLKFSISTYNKRYASNLINKINIFVVKNGIKHTLLDTTSKYLKTFKDTINFEYSFISKNQLYGDSVYLYLTINFKNGCFISQSPFIDSFFTYGRPNFFRKNPN